MSNLWLDLFHTQLSKIQTLVWRSGINVYNLYQECYGGVQDLTLRWDKERGKYVTSNSGWPFMFLKDTEVSRRREVGITVSNDFLLFGRRSNYYSHNANISLGNNVVCSLNG